MSKTRASGRTVGGLRSLSLQAPAVTLLLLWMLVPLGMTVWFSLQRYNLLMPGMEGFAGLEDYEYLFTDPALWRAMGNTLLLVGSVLVITVGGGVLLAVLFQQEFPGRGIARVLAISPFFVMPTVSALVWKNMMMHPSNGVLSWVAGVFGLPAVDWFSSLPLTSIVIIVAWQWLPFALLILLTAMQSLDDDQVEAARMDGAGPIAVFFYITLPHLKRAISVVIMIEMIFLLTIFAEIYVTTSGGPGLATTNLAFLIYIQALLDFDVGLASAGGVVAIVLANIVAIFLVRLVAKNLEN
ncbi:carbohydrate ABC transporter permease [Billgrantia bachuensis]|uniref:Sugar ABC transporter permease n=1 Tax=Billgrantia bachuensis TaxID=2717286 RepID=A0ABX0PZ31_9GAMM|nr:sugar ABC transporter permease [Halomonas bachuensis]NIC07502.1 sugar ABC transporter permease [Halomonas bachuensis]